MVAIHRPALTARQLAVLRWISDGCPDGVWPDHSHKLLVGRLETLNLVSIRRWYGKWNAVLQPDGEYYLQHSTYPTPPPGRSRPTSEPAVAAAPPIKSTSAVRPAARQEPPAIDRTSTEQLVARIAATDGSLTVTTRNETEHRKLKAQIHAAQRHHKTPPGTHLVVDQPRWETFILNIEELPDWMAEPPVEVPVPSQLRRPHDAIAVLRDDEHLLPITGTSRRRALILLQALVAAATKRGHTVTAIRRQDRHGRSQPAGVHLSFTVAGHDIGLRISQLSDRTDHVPTPKELADKQRYSYYSIPRYDYTPSDRLKLELTNSAASSWKDGIRRKLENRLPEILQAIEHCAHTAERAKIAAEERKRQQELEQERQIARATQRLIQAHRTQILDEQVTAWTRARQLNNYLTALTAIVEAITEPEDKAAAVEWLTWARNHADCLNPLNATIAMPPDPEPTWTALQPHMERPYVGW